MLSTVQNISTVNSDANASDNAISDDSISKEVIDRQSRATNVLLFNFSEQVDDGRSESSSSRYTQAAINLLSSIHTFNGNQVSSRRVGRYNVNKIRPLIVTLPSASDAINIL